MTGAVGEGSVVPPPGADATRGPRSAAPGGPRTSSHASEETRASDETHARRSLRGWRRTGFGRPPPIPPWAVAVVGGALAAPIAALATSQLAAVRGRADLASVTLHVLPALVVYGVAAGALATITTGRSERRIALLGGLLGAVTGLLALAAVWIHEAFFLAVMVALTSLPAALTSVARRLPAREAIPLWALSLVAVAAGTLPLGFAILMLNRFLVHVRHEVLLEILVATVGALAWYRPASYRPGARE